ncbi:MAG TPA: hypothetical protein QF753_05395 [Victivallales bacterium]|nr:hypothetical protein [Victivallales bacterium]
MTPTILTDEKVQKTISFINHPLAEATLHDKENYLKALSVIVLADSEIKDLEKTYFASILNTFNIDKSKLNDFLCYAEETSIFSDRHSIAKTLANCEYTAAFIIDAMVIAHIDYFHDVEKKVMEKFLLLYGLQKNISKELLHELTRMFSNADSFLTQKEIEKFEFLWVYIKKPYHAIVSILKEYKVQLDNH